MIKYVTLAIVAALLAGCGDKGPNWEEYKDKCISKGGAYYKGTCTLPDGTKIDPFE